MCIPGMPSHVGLRHSGRPVRWISDDGSLGGPMEILSEPRADGAVLLGVTPFALDEEGMVSGRMTAELVRGTIVEGQMVQWRLGKYRSLHDVVLVEERQLGENRSLPLTLTDPL